MTPGKVLMLGQKVVVSLQLFRWKDIHLSYNHPYLAVEEP